MEIDKEDETTTMYSPSDTTNNIVSLEHAYSEEQLNNVQLDDDALDTMSTSSSSVESPMYEPTTSAHAHDPKPIESTNNSPVPEPAEQPPTSPEPKQPEAAPETTKISRELRSLLEAMKESNLDTNIAHKRESRNKYGESKHDTSGSLLQDGKQTNQKKDGGMTPKTPKKKDNLHDDSADGSSGADEKKGRKSVDVFAYNVKPGKDMFCWRCHRDGHLIHCETCPRSYHTRCLKTPVLNPDRWPCPECLSILQAESTKTRSPAMKDMPLEHLCELLKYAAKRMMSSGGAEDFIQPVDSSKFPDYHEYVVQPMDLTTMENNIRNNLYGSTVAFIADTKWILHNSIIYNSYQSKFTTAAKSILKICKQEMAEIETCSECYKNANTKKTSWFVQVCSRPHILLWAKLKGFPYWPAKGMTINQQGLVDVRFFGAHDRAWVPVKDCFLYSTKDPNTTNKNKRANIAECIRALKEVDVHIEKLKERYGDFVPAPYRTIYDPNTELEQLSFMLPKFKPPPKSSYTRKIPEAAKKRGQARSRSRTTSEDKKSKVQKESKTTNFIDFEQALLNTTETPDEKDTKNDSIIDDKGMEGYGTEDDDMPASLNTEVRKKITDYASEDSDDETLAKTLSKTNGNEENEKSDDELDREMEITTRGSVKTRSFSSAGKLKVIGDRALLNELISRKRSLPPSPIESPKKLARRNSDISTVSNSSKTSNRSEKINRVKELSETMEVSLSTPTPDLTTVSYSETTSPEKESRPDQSDKADLANLKPVVQISTGDLYNKNKEVRISPQSKAASIADKLIRKITETDIDAVAKTLEPFPDTEESSPETEQNITEPDETETVDGDKSITESVQSSDSASAQSENDEDEQMEVLKDISGLKKYIDGVEPIDKNKEKPVTTDKKSIEEEENPKDETTTVPTIEKQPVVELSSDSTTSTPKTTKTAAVIVGKQIDKTLEPPSLVDIATPETILNESIDIKLEPDSDLSDEESEKNSTPRYDVTLTVVEKQKKGTEPDKTSFKVVDNITSVIDAVASNSILTEDPMNLNKKEITLRPISKLINSPTQKARKSFPSSGNRISSYQTVQIRKLIQEKKDTTPKNPTVQIKIPPLQSISTHTSSVTTTTSTPQPSTSIINNLSLLTPNQPITLHQNMSGGSIYTVQQSACVPSLIIQPNSVVSLNTQVNPAPPATSTTTQTQQVESTSTSTGTTAMPELQSEEDYLISTDITKTIGDMFVPQPPRLKPRPPGPLATNFDEGLPGNAGPTTKLINSVAHRFSDYFRGLIKETLDDLSTMDAPEAKIRKLELEIETLKYKHADEVKNMRNNISRVLKDIQQSVIEEKAKAIDETRALCEAERIRCVEEAKTKQWCAFCLKEARFYCCWNTSYCDYPCQQKHWAQHMKTCSQSTIRTLSSATSGNGSNSLDKSKQGTRHTYTNNKSVMKPTRMIVKQTNKQGVTTMFSPIQRNLQAGQQTITLVESRPGNFEIVGNHGPIALGGKIIQAKQLSVKTGNVIVASSASSSTSQTGTTSQKTLFVAQKPANIAPKITASVNDTDK